MFSKPRLGRGVGPGLRSLERPGDLLGDLRPAPGEVVLRDAQLDQRRSSAGNRVAREPFVELSFRAVLGRVRPRMPDLAVGERLDQRGAPATARPLDRLAGGGVHREQVVAVDDDAGHRV